MQGQVFLNKWLEDRKSIEKLKKMYSIVGRIGKWGTC